MKQTIKRMLTGLLLLALCLQGTILALAEGGYGDVNGDQVPDATDALQILKYSVAKMEKPEGDAFQLADVSGDGILNARDALLILQFSVEKLSSFPVQNPTLLDPVVFPEQEDGYVMDLDNQYPYFTSESGLKNWLLDGTDKPEDRETILNTLCSNNTVTYYRPGISAEEDFKLRGVEIHTPSSSLDYIYDYLEVDPDGSNCALSFGVHHIERESINYIYTFQQERLQNQEEGMYSVTVNGIDYIYARSEWNDVTQIYWKQFGFVQTASLYGHYDQIDQILPLLKLERITLRTDVVTQ